jgi:hypothetical protein
MTYIRKDAAAKHCGFAAAFLIFKFQFEAQARFTAKRAPACSSRYAS